MNYHLKIIGYFVCCVVLGLIWAFAISAVIAWRIVEGFGPMAPVEILGTTAALLAIGLPFIACYWAVRDEILNGDNQNEPLTIRYQLCVYRPERNWGMWS